jgi:sialate O-acetylesterase
MNRSLGLGVIVMLLAYMHANANVRLPKLFGDNMVLQRGKNITVWGWANPGEKITVRFAGQVQQTKAAADSSWAINFKPVEAGGPYTLIAQAKNIITINNILVGELWISSGQSNMDWPVRMVTNAQEEISKSDFPMIRHFKTPSTVSGEPQKDLPSGEWQIAGPKTTGDFSAVSYFFARKLYQQLHVPIGIINSSWGGTIAETWISKVALENNPVFTSIFKNASFAEIEAKNEKQYQDIIKELESTQGATNGSANIFQWKDPAFSDNDWKTLAVPVNFDQSGLAKFDGQIWFRKTVKLTKEDAQAEGLLRLGTIDDADITYVNGQEVGKTEGYNLLREYIIPKGILREGDNVIAVRVHDILGNGGFFSQPSVLQLVSGATITPLAGDWKYRIESVSKSGVNPNSYPSLLFNSMISPLLPMSIRGVIWYQGESNADHAFQYRTTFPLLINDWRKHFNQGEFPFYYVQLAGYNAANGNSEKGSQWAELREAQTMTLSLPNTGMAVAFDIGESGDIHPRNKQEVSRRLAVIALHNVYKQNIAYAGPQFKSMKMDNNRAIIEFNYADSGMLGKDKWGYIRGFEMAGSDKKFYYAQAKAEGNKIIVISDLIKQPVAVRYAWADDMPEANLYNKEGFPAVPFRTDDWNTITQNEKYSIN